MKDQASLVVKENNSERGDEVKHVSVPEELEGWTRVRKTSGRVPTE